MVAISSTGSFEFRLLLLSALAGVLFGNSAAWADVPASKPKTTSVSKPALKPKPVATAKPKAKKKPKTSLAPVPVKRVTAPAPAAPVQPVAPAPALVPLQPTAAVRVPSTEHVHVELEAGLQAWLDADDRMRPWLGKAIVAVDACYAQERTTNASAGGVIAFRVTMHENARPSGAVSSLPGALSGMVLCVTSRLLSVKMPLFTGREGDSYTVRVHFDP